MVKRSIGISFIVISVILIGYKWIVELVGSAPVAGTIINFSLLIFLAGLCFLAWGEYDKHKGNKRNSG
jgi:apolipoprotein N-acyltransferase